MVEDNATMPPPPPRPSQMMRTATVASESLDGRFLHAMSDDLGDASGKALFQSVASVTTKRPTSWRVFTDEEDLALQTAWFSLNVEAREKAMRLSTGEGKNAAAKNAADTRTDGSVIAEPDAAHQPHLIPVGLDHLFDVNLLDLSLAPVFWKGSRVDVQFGTWFMPSSTVNKFYPVEPLVAEALEAAYQDIKPWTAGFEDELRSAVALGAEAEAKLKVELRDHHCDVLFQGAEHARLYPHTMTSRLSKSIWTTFSSRGQHAGGQLVVRGYRAATEWRGRTGGTGTPTRTASRPSTPTPRKRVDSNASESTVASENGEKRASISMPTSTTSKLVSLLRAGKKESSGSAVADEGESLTAEAMQADRQEGVKPVSELAELVLVLHGIGQRLADSYESFRIVHAVNDLRANCTKHASDESFAPLTGNRRLQFIPVQWRSSLRFPHERPTTEQQEAEANDDPNINRFTVDDIEVKDSGIAFARQLISGCILDFPTYMSPLGQRMLEAVIRDANNIYRLFCKRNPDFTGRVSIIAHSLGTALAIDVLSKQPTWVPPLAEQSLEQQRTQEHFVFNTRALVCLGSPVAFFFSLREARLIARKGRGRSDQVDPAASAEGGYGCPALDDMYNVYFNTDPIAYTLNAVVDAKYAKYVQPIAIPSQTSTLFETIGGSLSRAWAYLPGAPWSSSSAATTTTTGTGEAKPNGDKEKEKDEESPRSPTAAAMEAAAANAGKAPARPGMGAKMPTLMRLPSSTALDKKQMAEVQLAAARFKALNPSGSLDFYLPSEAYSSYLDMLVSHAAYWADPRFSAFLVTQLLAPAGNLEQAREKMEDEAEDSPS